ncbi:MAG: ABC transporter ATP-binding protein [Candidatus Omnitrophica bacterium]|nr:ABC transporter ATP-binding protein [Candidatus Omnitrophota bacterium]
MNSGGILLKARGLVKRYRTAGGALTVLDNLDLEVKRGSVCFIIGRSGSGKTTLLHLLGGLDRPDSGTVECKGENIHALPEHKCAEFRNRHLGFVFQFYHLLPELTLIENLLLPSEISGGSLGEAKKRAGRLLEELDLRGRDRHFPSQLSGGEQQRVAVARALMNEPDLVFCDEPTGNLDKDNAEKMTELIKKLNREHQQTFCIVTHEEALVRGQANVYRLEGGQLEAVEILRSTH